MSVLTKHTVSMAPVCHCDMLSICRCKSPSYVRNMTFCNQIKTHRNLDSQNFLPCTITQAVASVQRCSCPVDKRSFQNHMCCENGAVYIMIVYLMGALQRIDCAAQCPKGWDTKEVAGTAIITWNHMIRFLWKWIQFFRGQYFIAAKRTRFVHTRSGRVMRIGDCSAFIVPQ